MNHNNNNNNNNINRMVTGAVLGAGAGTAVTSVVGNMGLVAMGTGVAIGAAPVIVTGLVIGTLIGAATNNIRG